MKKRTAYSSLLVCVCLVVVAALFSMEARAEYPDRPISIWVQYAAGGSQDMIVRTIAPIAAKTLGQPIMVDNRPGASGAVALALIANAKPDGYLLCAGTDSSIVRNPQLQKVQYKPLKSFTPLIAYAAVQNAICVRKEAPWKTLKELVDYARQNPNKIKYGSGGVGSGMHHAMALIGLKAGIKWIHVPYKGNQDAMTALMGGHVDVVSAGPEIYPFERGGQVRILAIAENKRHPKYPDIPTLTELGYEFANDAYFTIVGPAGLPQDVQKKFISAWAKGLEAKEVKTLMDELDLQPVLLEGKDYENRLKEYWPRMEKSLKETGLIKEPATSPY